MSKPFPDHFLAPCGPVDRLLAKLSIMTPDQPRLVRRAVIAALFTWLPLLVLTLLRPNSDVDVTFTGDIAAHARFLLIIPLLLAAEAPIGRRSQMVVVQFLASGLVSDADVERFERARRRGRGLLESAVAEVVILAVSAVLVAAALHGLLQNENVMFWYEHVTPGGIALTAAGRWYFYVATPIFVFLVLRWVWRYGIWWWFLHRVSRLDLRLTGTHPDRLGGLGFVPYHQSMFAMIAFAVGCTVSAAAADRLLHGFATLKHYQWPIGAIAVLSVIVGVAPLLVFTPRLVMTKRRAWSLYTRFASDYVWQFEQKWLRQKDDESSLGSGDIQSLADLGGSFERMVTMRTFAIERRLMITFAVAAVLPSLPLLLTVMPLKEILKVLVKAMV